MAENVHPRVLVDGIELAKNETLRFLETFKITKEIDRELLLEVARASLMTKIHPKLAEQLTDIVTDAVL